MLILKALAVCVFVLVAIAFMVLWSVAMYIHMKNSRLPLPYPRIFDEKSDDRP